MVGDGECNTDSPDLDCSWFDFDGGDCSKSAMSAEDDYTEDPAISECSLIPTEAALKYEE